MVEYTLNLQVSQQTSQPVLYNLHFKSSEEDNPESKFTAEIRESMRHSLQKQTSCSINNNNLNKIINLWIGDIKEGYRTTSISIDLPSTDAESLKDLEDTGNQEIPQLILPDLAEIEPLEGMLPPLNF